MILFTDILNKDYLFNYYYYYSYFLTLGRGEIF